MTTAATPRPFRALVMKELRSNARWMLLGFVATSGILGTAFMKLSSSEEPQGFLEALTSFPVLTLCAGLLLGVVTSFSESQGDSYGFLVHRPVTRREVFAAKVTGGLLLYVGSVGLPLVIALVWGAWPGHLPEPFDILLLRAPVIDLLCGAVGFFLGFLCTMRTARWYATRWIGVLAVAWLTVEALSAPTFLLAAALCLLALLVSGMAAGGAFVTAGRYETQALPTRIATTLTLATSLFVVGLVARSLFVTFVGSLLYSSRETPVQFEVSDTTMVVTPAGPVRVVRKNDRIVSATDLNGVEIDAASLENLQVSVTSTQLTLDPRARVRSEGAYRDWRDAYSKLQPGPDARGIFWYFVHRSRLVVGYDQTSRRAVAWAGPDGFVTSAREAARRFEEPLISAGNISTRDGSSVLSFFLTFRSAVYLLDPAERVVEQRFSASDDEAVTAAANNLDGWLAVATTQGLHLLGPNNVPGTMLRHPDSTAGFRSVTLHRFRAPRTDAVYLLYQPKQNPGFLDSDASGGTLRELIKFTVSGEVQARYHVPRRASMNWPSPRGVEQVAVALSRPTLELLNPTFRAGAPAGIPVRRPSWFVPLMIGLAVASGLLNALIATRYLFPLSRILTWTAVGLIMGPLGIALMAATLEWPKFEACPGCGRRRVLTRTLCRHCAKPFAAPVRDGTEIFA